MIRATTKHDRDQESRHVNELLEQVGQAEFLRVPLLARLAGELAGIARHVVDRVDRRATPVGGYETRPAEDKGSVSMRGQLAW